MGRYKENIVKKCVVCGNEHTYPWTFTGSARLMEEQEKKHAVILTVCRNCLPKKPIIWLKGIGESRTALLAGLVVSENNGFIGIKPIILRGGDPAEVGVLTAWVKNGNAHAQHTVIEYMFGRQCTNRVICKEEEAETLLTAMKEIRKKMNIPTPTLCVQRGSHSVKEVLLNEVQGEDFTESVYEQRCIDCGEFVDKRRVSHRNTPGRSLDD